MDPKRLPPTLDALRRRAADCTACDLYKGATQTVFGKGPARAPIVIVGEQPGNEEDLAGRPFVGPAGRLLDQALAEAGLHRRRIYVTNAAKHFKWKGVTAAQAVLRRRVTIRDARGRALVSPQGAPTFVTIHPSAILRVPDRDSREAELHRLASDLRRAAARARDRRVSRAVEETTR